MDWMNNLKLSHRLLIAFGTVTALTILLGFVSYRAISDLDAEVSLAQENMAELESTARLGDIASRFRIQTFTLIVPSSDAAKQAARDAQAARAAEFEERFAKLTETPPANAQAQALRDQVKSSWDTFKESAEMIDQLVGMELAEDATDMTIGDANVHYNELMKAIDELVAASVRAAATAEEEAHSTYRAASGTILTVALFSLLISIIAALLVSRSVSNGVRDAVRMLGEIADGRLDGKIDQKRKDEIGELNAGMARMQNTLKAFVDAEIEMAKQHEAGMLDYRISAADFHGAYADMAVALNDLVAGQIDTMSSAVTLMRRYAVGDLSQDMAPLPGQKAQISETMAQTKANLEAVNGEIQRLVHAAAQGDFSMRGNEQQFEFAFREMVVGLNQLMQQADAGLGEVGRLLGALSRGDLTVRVDNKFKGAFHTLVENANVTVERLTDIARNIGRSSESINVAASELSAGNADLSTRTEQQAANLEETASSMEELTSTVKQNAENSRQARQLAVGAADVAARGGEVVGRVVSTMNEISESSKRIEDIISVIDGIAFQTNILALNAAVEAARAGEQGRGFAVVASEVRSLAQRSADAAKEIKELIADSVITVETGSSLVEQAGKTMDEIVSSVRRVTDIMSEIAAASDEQSSGIEQVNQTIVHMDETTQQNAALVEQASATARTMEEQAVQLAQAVSVFRLADQATGRPALAPTTGTKSSTGAAKPAPASASAPAKKPAAAPARPVPAPATKPVPKPVARKGKQDEIHWEEF